MNRTLVFATYVIADLIRNPKSRNWNVHEQKITTYCPLRQEIKKCSIEGKIKKIASKIPAHKIGICRDLFL